MRNLFVLLLSQVVCISGFLINYRAKKRLENLQKCLLIFEQIETNIAFCSDNVYSLIEKINEKSYPCFLNKFLSYNSNESLSERWRKSVSESKFKDCFKNEDEQILISFGKMFGITDSEGQMKNCLLHKKMMENNFQKALREKEKRGNLVTTLSVIGSIMIIVLLI